MAYPCDNEDGNQAVLLVTNLDEGSTLALCGACVPLWVSGMAAALAPDTEDVSYREAESPAFDPAPGDADASADYSGEPAAPGPVIDAREDDGGELADDTAGWPFSDETVDRALADAVTLDRAEKDA